MFKFGKLMVSLVSTFGLFLASNHFSTIEAEAAYPSNYNSSALEECGISEAYLNDLLQNWESRNKLSTIEYYANASQRDQFEKDVMAMFAWEGIIGHAYPSHVNNKIQIKYSKSEDKFYIKQSGGSAAIDQLFLAYVEDLGDIDMMYEMYNSKGSNMKQPTITVNGNNIDFYIPYVYYNSGTRQYIAKQLSNKLEVLTGKKFNVTFRTSKKDYVQSIDGKIDAPIYNARISEFISGVFAYDGYSVSPVEKFKGLPTYKNGQYLANADTITVDGYCLSDMLTIASNHWHNGSNALLDRKVCANLVWNMFYSADVNKIVFHDCTITLTAGRYLQIICY